MHFLLGTDNVGDYLMGQRLSGYEGARPTQVQPKRCKNFNLLVEFSNRQSLLLKQESRNTQGGVNGDLRREWQIHQLLRTCSDLAHLQHLTSHAVAFDQQHALLILCFLKQYTDLDTVYREQDDYPEAIAPLLGITLAEFHRCTLDRPEVKTFLLGDRSAEGRKQAGIPDFTKILHCITPETFGQVTAEGLKFYALVQRYESLGRAIAHLTSLYHPCCLIHGDLKFSNLLLHHHWQAHTTASSFAPRTAGEDAPVRLIDWEKWRWGDPAFDLGGLLAEYLKRWLKSLLTSPDIPIEQALQLATTPLEQVQPSMVHLLHAYLHHIPEILERFPNFLSRVMCFTGWALLESIQAHIHYYEPFDNVGICMLQVAKTLLCTPEAAMSTVLGQEVEEGRGQRAEGVRTED